MKSADNTTTLEELKQLVRVFRDERDWAKHHTPRNLAVSIAVEAAELLEHFQWDDYTTKDKQAIADELGDILIYCFNFADTMNIDIATAFKEKLAKAAKKYPVELFNKDRESTEDYHRIKQSHRQKK